MRRLWVVLLLLTSCVPKAPVQEFAVRIGTVGPLTELTAFTVQSDTVYLTPLVYEPFLAPAEAGAWRSNVAAQWSFEANGKLKLKLRPDLRFGDGTPVDTTDVIRSFDAAGLKAVEQDGWFLVESKAPAANLDALLLHAILHKQVGGKTLGTGPFRMTLSSPELIRLDRREPVAGKVNRVEMVGYEDSRQAFAALLKGSVNVMLGPDPGVLELVEGVPQFQIVRGFSLHAVAVAFNSARVAMDDRQAIAAALDVESIARAYADSCDPIRTRTAGQAPLTGRALEIITYDQDPPSGRAALAVRRQLGAKGGEVKILSTVEVMKRLRAHDFDILVSPIQVWPEASESSIWNSQSPLNLFSYANSSLDAAFGRRDYATASAIITREAPFIPICRRDRNAILDARLKNVTLGPYDMLESLPNWEVSQ